MKPTIKPLANRVLVRPTDQDPEEKTPGGIIVVKHNIPPSTEGMVVALGPTVESTLNIGDKIKYGNHSGVEIEWEGKAHIIMRDSEIICVL